MLRARRDLLTVKRVFMASNRLLEGRYYYHGS
jgi:hypothetical protein